MVLTKSFDPIYPVKWIMSFVKTSSLGSVEIREVDACFVYRSFMYLKRTHRQLKA